MDGAFVAPTFADWQGRAGALGLKRSGRELVGACPACGGNDRFAVKPVEGGAAVIHCRQCRGLIDIVKAAGLAEDRPTNGAAPVTVYEYRDPSGITNPENRRAHLIVLTRKGERTIMEADA